MQKSIKALLLAFVFVTTTFGVDGQTPEPSKDLQELAEELFDSLKSGAEQLKGKMSSAIDAAESADISGAISKGLEKASNELKKVGEKVAGFVESFEPETGDSEGNIAADLSAGDSEVVGSTVTRSGDASTSEDATIIVPELGLTPSAGQSVAASTPGVDQGGRLESVKAFCITHKYKVMAGVAVVTASGIAAYVYYKNRAVTEDELDEEAEAAVAEAQ